MKQLNVIHKIKTFHTLLDDQYNTFTNSSDVVIVQLWLTSPSLSSFVYDSSLPKPISDWHTIHHTACNGTLLHYTAHTHTVLMTISRSTWVSRFPTFCQSPKHPRETRQNSSHPHGTSGHIPPTYINCHHKGFWSEPNALHVIQPRASKHWGQASHHEDRRHITQNV